MKWVSVVAAAAAAAEDIEFFAAAVAAVDAIDSVGSAIAIVAPVDPSDYCFSSALYFDAQQGLITWARTQLNPCPRESMGEVEA